MAIIEEQFRVETEQAFRDFEAWLTCSITIIDRDGIFMLPSGRMLFPHARVSHQKNRICELGFCHRCIDHCRYEMNKEGESRKTPFLHTCWKGLQELLVPIIWEDIHLGSLYVGIWRSEQGIPDSNKPMLPASFEKAFLALPTLDAVDIGMIKRVLVPFIQGVLVHLDKLTMIQDRSGGRAARINHFVKYNAVKAVTLNDLAETLSLSASRTSHLVKELFGRSFQQLILAERLKRAQGMLISTELTAGEIAAQVGFHDVYHFNRTFKREMGIPPGLYRKQQQPTTGS